MFETISSIKQNANVSRAETISLATKYLRDFTKHIPPTLGISWMDFEVT